MDINNFIEKAEEQKEFAAVEFFNFIKVTAETNNMEVADVITYLLSCKQPIYKKNLLNILRKSFPKTDKKYIEVSNANSINISKINIIKNR